MDQSPLVARRLGFATLPLAVLAILIGSQSIRLLFSLPYGWTNEEYVHLVKWIVMGLLFWVWYVQ